MPIPEKTRQYRDWVKTIKVGQVVFFFGVGTHCAKVTEITEKTITAGTLVFRRATGYAENYRLIDDPEEFLGSRGKPYGACIHWHDPRYNPYNR